MPRPGLRTTYKYSDRFKATAVWLSQLHGVSVQEVAESLYILPSCRLVGASKHARDRWTSNGTVDASGRCLRLHRGVLQSNPTSQPSWQCQSRGI